MILVEIIIQSTTHIREFSKNCNSCCTDIAISKKNRENTHNCCCTISSMFDPW